MASILYDHVWNTHWMSDTLIWLSTKLPCKDARESTLTLWRETWKLKDIKQLSDRKMSSTLLFGNEQTSSSMNLCDMYNYKGSIDIMSEKQKPIHFLIPKGNYTVALPWIVSGLHATYRLNHPNSIPAQMELQYEGLEHWLFNLKLPLSPTQIPTIMFGITPICHAFSVPFKIEWESSRDEEGIIALRVANWSVGLKREASAFSFGFNVSQTITVAEDNKSIKKTETTASCKVETSCLSASADWNGKAFKCSFKQEEDLGFSITSACLINFQDATKNVCSVGLGKKWKHEEQLHRGLQVVFDTRDVTKITFSHSLSPKFSLQLSATVDARDINHSQLRAKFFFT